MGMFFRKPEKYKSKPGKYWGNIKLAVDQMGGALLGIHHDETISSHLGKCERGQYRFPWWGKPIHWALEKIDAGHCKRAVEEDEGFITGRIFAPDDFIDGGY